MSIKAGLFYIEAGVIELYKGVEYMHSSQMFCFLTLLQIAIWWVHLSTGMDERNNSPCMILHALAQFNQGLQQLTIQQ